MLDWITGTIADLGYAGIAGLMFLENIYPPLPSEIIMPLAGFTVAEGSLNFFLVALAGTVGSVIGTSIWYYLGHLLGKERLEKFVDRHGKWLTVTRKDIERADHWFDRHNTLAVFFGRLIPGVRSVISLPAGISGMSFIPFLVSTTLGTLLWTTALTYIGFVLRENWIVVEDYVKPFLTLFILFFVLWYIVRFIKQSRGRKLENKI